MMSLWFLTFPQTLEVAIMRQDRKKFFIPVLLLLMIFSVFLVACGGTVTTAGGSSFAVSTTAKLPLKLTTLHHSPAGTADLAWNPDTKRLTVTLVVTGLAPNSWHAAHIHVGTCAAGTGAIIHQLTTVKADGQGNAKTVTMIEQIDGGIPASGWYVNVHNGLGMSTLDQMQIACSNITGGDPQHVRVKLGGTISLEESASGKVELVMVDGKLQLKVTVFGLQPGSTHVAHIHSGRCEAQGPAIVMLNSVVADAGGKGISLTSMDEISNRLSTLHVSASPQKKLYINVHLAATMADLAQPTLFDPIACGNLSLSLNGRAFF
jgi:hypothetical protein